MLTFNVVVMREDVGSSFFSRRLLGEVHDEVFERTNNNADRNPSSVVFSDWTRCGEQADYS